MSKSFKLLLLICWIPMLCFSQPTVKDSQKEVLTVALAGLSHDHVYLVMQHYKKGEVKIIGIAEKDQQLINRFKKNYQLPDSIFFNNLPDLLKHKKPEIVMAFGPVSEHLNVVRDCAPARINVMVEKPLATTVKGAEEIVKLADKFKIKVLTNYETSWYASNQNVYKQVKAHQIGDIRRMVAHDGHQGPKEINVSKEFLKWLTDPDTNGAGALYDFGCYGANLMTWLMDGQAPISVTAFTKQIKPDIYPKVDDDATIILEYREATGIIEASWNWPFSIKDLEVFGQTGYIQAVDGQTIRTKDEKDDTYITKKLAPPASPYQDYIPYVTAVLRGEIDPSNDLSSLKNNLMVVKILEAAKRSAKEKKRILIR